MIEFEFDDGGLKDLQKKLEGLPEEQAVTFDKLFPPAFMAQYTDFKTIDEMLDATGDKIDGADDFDALPEGVWEKLVKQRTRFKDWEDMKGKAAQEWTAQELGLDR